jgi:putative SOS response-associated peptidase YedK
MCGRYTLTVDPAQLLMRFELDSADIAPAPRFNIAPTQTTSVVLNASPRTLSAARWGLVPFWAKDIAIGSKMFNARAETLGEKPAFRTLLDKRRCLVLADSFYEWRREPDGSKTPMRIMLASGEPFAFAGLWDVWKTPGGERMTSCSVITCAPNALVAPIHDRMPAILASRDDERDWLDNTVNGTHAQSLLRSHPVETMKAYAVSTRVGNVRNDDPALIEPADG